MVIQMGSRSSVPLVRWRRYGSLAGARDFRKVLLPREVVALHFNGGSGRAGRKLLNPQYFGAATDEKGGGGQRKSLGEGQGTFKFLINFALRKRNPIEFPPAALSPLSGLPPARL